ncbi:MAG: hypothetical protein WBY38_02095, partial [Candidatus Acidiferrales bacterium]
RLKPRPTKILGRWRWDGRARVLLLTSQRLGEKAAERSGAARRFLMSRLKPRPTKILGRWRWDGGSGVPGLTSQLLGEKAAERNGAARRFFYVAAKAATYKDTGTLALGWRTECAAADIAKAPGREVN